MRNKFLGKKINSWLLPTVLILFILQVLLLPWAVGLAWADRSDSAAHTLTYTQNNLAWDSATNILPDGSAELKLFSDEYEKSVLSQNDEKLVAPGTANEMFIRLKNDEAASVNYTIVLYQIKSDDRLSVEPVLSGTGFADTKSYSLPKNVSQSQVLRAVTTTVGGGKLQDLDLGWNWQFEEDDARDVVDTTLANMENLPDVSAGVYIVVEDNNSYVTPQAPQTGDSRRIGVYLGLMAISLILLIFLLFERKGESKRESV